MKKRLKIGEYKDNGRIVDVVSYFGSKNQPRDNEGRYIHIDATPEHIDNYEKRNKEGKCQHIAIAELETISFKDLPKTDSIPWNYNNFCVGAKEPGTGIEIEKHRGSVTIRGSSRPTGILLLGSADPSQIW